MVKKFFKLKKFYFILFFIFCSILTAIAMAVFKTKREKFETPATFNLVKAIDNTQCFTYSANEKDNRIIGNYNFLECDPKLNGQKWEFIDDKYLYNVKTEKYLKRTNDSSIDHSIDKKEASVFTFDNNKSLLNNDDFLCVGTNKINARTFSKNCNINLGGKIIKS
jgi:hypothetical protein